MTEDCIRSHLNWLSLSHYNRFDSPQFNPIQTYQEIQYKSPKITRLLKNMERLDKADKRRFGHSEIYS